MKFILQLQLAKLIVIDLLILVCGSQTLAQAEEGLVCNR